MDQSARVRWLGFVEAYSERLFGLFLFACLVFCSSFVFFCVSLSDIGTHVS